MAERMLDQVGKSSTGVVRHSRDVRRACRQRAGHAEQGRIVRSYIGSRTPMLAVHHPARGLG
jgi:hypothetical protein